MGMPPATWKHNPLGQSTFSIHKARPPYYGKQHPIRPTIHFLYFPFRRYFANVFTKHATKHETLAIHFSYFMQISSRKNKPQNHLTFRANADPGAKCCEMQKAKKRGAKCKKSGAKYPKWRKIHRYTRSDTKVPGQCFVCSL